MKKINMKSELITSSPLFSYHKENYSTRISNSDIFLIQDIMPKNILIKDKLERIYFSGVRNISTGLVKQKPKSTDLVKQNHSFIEICITS